MGNHQKVGVFVGALYDEDDEELYFVIELHGNTYDRRDSKRIETLAKNVRPYYKTL